MMTVHEVSRLTGVSIRALHYYDEIGLLSPAVTTEAGYRLYDTADLRRLQQIMLLRELEVSLKEIRRIIDSPSFDRNAALEQQIRLLKLKREHLEQLISFAQNLQETGEYDMSFQAFDTQKIRQYAAEAKEKWGGSDAYREYEAKTADYSADQHAALSRELMDIFAAFGQIRESSPGDPPAQALVQKLQDFITANYYTCTAPILAGLGQIYAGGEMTDNIDRAGGRGTAEFAAKAIEIFCK